MNYYEDLEDKAVKDGFKILELPLKSGDGRCKGRRIAIRQNIPSLKRKADILAEEWAHGKLTVGDISDQSITENRKQERRARILACHMRLPLLDIVKAYKAHCRNVYEMSEYLDVSEEMIRDALEFYRQKYGSGAVVGDYYIQFEPFLQVGEYFNFRLQ